MWPIADAHTDFLMNLCLNRTSLRQGLQQNRQMSLPALKKGNVRLQVFAAFSGDPLLGHPLKQTIEQIRCYLNMLDAWADDVFPISNGIDLHRLEQDSRIASILSVEGGEAAAGSFLVLDILHLLGVRVMTLLWNRENELGYPAVDPNAVQKKLKPFGYECVEYLNKKGIAIDVSHLNRAGFWDVLEKSEVPVMASHSNAQALCAHPRNLDDRQIKALIESNGYIGLNFFPKFLTEGTVCTVEDIARHAAYMLEMGAEDILGFGSDFDGIDSTPIGIDGAQDFQLVAQALQKYGIDDALLEKICWKNLVRYLGRVLPRNT